MWRGLSSSDERAHSRPTLRRRQCNHREASSIDASSIPDDSATIHSKGTRILRTEDTEHSGRRTPTVEHACARAQAEIICLAYSRSALTDSLPTA